MGAHLTSRAVRREFLTAQFQEKENRKERLIKEAIYNESPMNVLYYLERLGMVILSVTIGVIFSFIVS